MKKSLSKLAQIYFDDANGQRFFDYIVESQVNGNFNQVVELFNELRHTDKAEFLIQLTEEDDCCQLPFSHSDRRKCFINIVEQVFKTR